MAHYNHLASFKILFGLIALMAAVAANASLLDCSQSQALLSNEDCLSSGSLSHVNSGYAAAVPATLPAVAAKADGFQVSKETGTAHIPVSVPLIGLICILLVVLLVRARAFSTK